MPRRLKERYPEIAFKDDTFRVGDRLIEEMLVGRRWLFSSPLMDGRLVSGSTVYDHNSDALAAGRAMAYALDFWG